MPPETIVNKAFEISPTSVYGFILAMLLLCIIALSLVCRELWKNLNEKGKEKDAMAATVLTVAANANSVMAALKDTIDELHDKVPALIDKTEGNLRGEIARAEHNIRESIRGIK